MTSAARWVSANIARRAELGVEIRMPRAYEVAGGVVRCPGSGVEQHEVSSRRQDSRKVLGRDDRRRHPRMVSRLVVSNTMRTGEPHEESSPRLADLRHPRLGTDFDSYHSATPRLLATRGHTSLRLMQ